MNLLESAVLLFSIGLFFLVLYKQGLPASQAALLLALGLPAFILSIREATQLVTTDEVYLLLGPSYIESSDLKAWNMGFFKTTWIVLVPVLKLIRTLFSPSEMWLKGLAKGLHWLTGFMTLLPIYWVATQLFVEKKLRPAFFLLFVYGCLLLPTTVAALKVFNYDLLSLNFSVFSWLLLIKAMTEKNGRASGRAAALAVVVAAYGAQEKLSASPFLLMAMSAYIYLGWKRSRHPLWHAPLKAFALAAAVFLSTQVMIIFCRSVNPPELTLVGFFHPLVAWAYPFFVKFTEGAVYQYPAGLYLLPLIVPAGVAWSGERVWKLTDTKKVSMIFRYLSLGCLAVIVACGLIGIYGQTTWWTPSDRVPVGLFRPDNSFNGFILHFGAQSALAHRFAYFAYACAHFLGFVPTVLWLGLAAFFSKPVSKLFKAPHYLGLQVGLLIAFLLPILFGATQTPVGGKYLNIPLLIFAMISVLSLTIWISRLAKNRMRLALGAIVMAIIAEVLPFGPLYMPFRPIWSQYSDEYNSKPVVGLVNTSWVGWGEESALAGKEVLSRCRAGADCHDVRIYCNYASDWLFAPPAFQIRCSAPWAENDYRYTDQDYYVLIRTMIIQGGNFPSQIKPLFTVSFRGFTEAWIYRGDQLKDLQFQF